MTELQMGLIGLGVAAVAGVLGYNKWQEMRHRKVAESLLKPHPEDPLLGGQARVAPAMPSAAPVVRTEPALMPEPVVPVSPERLEPVLAEHVAEQGMARMAEPVAPVAPVMPPPERMPEPVPAAPVMPAYVPPADEMPAMPVMPPVADLPPPAPVVSEEVLDTLPESVVPPTLLDPRLEYIVAMELVDPVPATQLINAQRDALARLHKPVHWVGFNERTREWERLSSEHDIAVRRLRVGLQLVNRLGPVPEADVAIFSNAMAALADGLMAVADMPSIRVLDQAAEIDRFCADVDLEIGINLVSRASAFSGTKIRALAEAAGMVLGNDGLFTRFDDEGRALYSLQNFETARFTQENIRAINTHGVTFLLDVPRVDHGERVFSQMIEQAKRFADTLQGALVDDNRQPLSDTQLDHIRREFIGKPQATMARYGLPAGSVQALRLFS